MKIKVCFFINTLDNSAGTERVSTVLANELVSCGYEVDIIAWYGGQASFYPVNNNIKIHYIFSNRHGNIYKDYLKSLRIYRRILKQIKPDYLVDVCVALSLLTIPAVKGTNIKVIAWEHFNTNVSWNPFTAKISRYLAARYAHSVVTLTNGDRENYETRFKARKAICISNPVTINFADKADLTQKNVLAIGRFTYQKGFDLLLPIWKTVVSQSPGWRLRIIGDGEQKQTIIKLAHELNITDTIDFIEPTNEVESYYRSSSIFVMTSRFEGLPLVLIEAKAFSLPIISYDCNTGPRDIVRNNVDGILVPYLDSDKFASELIGLMGDAERRKNFGKAASDDIDRFELKSILNSWKIILNS
jgi:glycosyltransferase involved in cell wall biosynthesis